MERKRERKLPRWLPPSLRSAVYLRRNRKWSAPDLSFSASSSSAINAPYLRRASRAPEAASRSFSVSSRESRSRHFSDSSCGWYPLRVPFASWRPDLLVRILVCLITNLCSKPRHILFIFHYFHSTFKIKLKYATAKTIGRVYGLSNRCACLRGAALLSTGIPWTKRYCFVISVIFPYFKF
jgi:hypothetical protein